ncbi:interleukin enhancer-binding factor 3-A-like [Mytilus galloprovincialis]|uniref:Spermatid perinuclear RNA-binding protein n=1 Tax=Mytilus galloprovincialis TaxID=29158 RepID=A0A8B6ERT9_MYTGA|nr:spermatid perinuclear RNA-binding protein [Mytilus galloprovincialis]
MDGEGDVKMESMPSASNGNGDVKPPVKTSVMVMPTGPAPMISNKHPVMHLNELTQESKFELVSEDKETGPSNKKRRVYTMMLMCKNEKFQGIGQSKKIAKEEAAKYALLKLFNILYIPDASMSSFVPEGMVLGKRPGEESPQAAEPGSKKKKKNKEAEGPKNPVMRLHELRSGLEYVVESQSGPVHAPVFVMSVVVDGLKYEGCGNSKKKAKVDVASKALNAVEPPVAEQTIKCEPSTTT